jgi:hypothetical protein
VLPSGVPDALRVVNNIGPMPLNVPDTILLEVGKVAAWLSRIERQMVVFLEEFGDLTGPRPSIPSGFYKLAKTTEEVLVTQFGPQHRYCQRFAGFRARMNPLITERNETVHGLWSFGPTFDSSTAVRTVTERKRKQISPEATVFSLEQLRDLVRRLEGIEWEISDLRVHICYYEVDLWLK